jgi:WD40 repeat protein/nucleoside phosphorylase/uncharacterized protein YjbI with pentapeptide repeats
MAVLPRYFAVKNLEKIQSALPSGQQKLLETMMGMLDPDGRVNAIALRNALFPIRTSEQSANTMLRRLLDNINAAAKTKGIQFHVETTADKRAGDKRQVWFEGAAGPTTQPHTGDLNRIPEAVRFSDQRGMILGKPVVLMTFNDHEAKAVLEVFSPHGTAAPTETRAGHTYTRLGIHGDVEVLHMHSRQGNQASQASAQAAIDAWQPAAIIPVGIAFGMNSGKQHIGDVLVSEYLRDYETVRVNADNTVTPRGTRPQASDVLIDRVRHLNMARCDGLDWPSIHLGVLMCGNKLVDCRPFRDDLRKIEPEAVGGEMEGIGVETAARRARVEWIVVKAICDWADGGKNSSSKTEDQQLAARHAALVVHAILSAPNLFPHVELKSNELVSAQPPIQRRNGLAAPTAGRMGLKDCHAVPERLLERGAKAITAGFDGKDRNAIALGKEADNAGVPVLSHLHDWIADVKAPPLFALLGEYGMGKTITSQQLALELDARRKEDPTQPIPLYFDLRHITRLGERVPTLADALEECMARGWLDEGDASDGYLLENVHRWIEQGAVVIFDGLDEVLVKLTESDGQVFTNNLLKLIADARARAKAEGRGLRLKVLTTCRTQYFPTLQAQNNYFTQNERGEFSPTQYRAMLLLPWRGEQVRSYLEQAVPGMDVEQVLQTVASVHNLQELTQRPYTLKLVAEFIPDIERDRAAGLTIYGVTLYRKMAEKWLARDSGKHHIRPEHKQMLAMYLAAHLWQTASNALPAMALNGWFHQWLDGDSVLRRRYQSLHPDQLEEDLRTATFLSRIDEDGESTFRFAHTSLLEFFLASYLLQAIRENQPQRWAMRVPSNETLDFLGQMLAEASSLTLLQTLQGWRKQYLPLTSELVLAYALRARNRNWPQPILHGMDLRGAVLRAWRIGGGTGAPLDFGAANFSGADLRDVVIENVRLAGVKFDHARLGAANFLGCDLAEAHFDHTELTATIFRRCNLAMSSWQGALGYRTQWLLCKPDQGTWVDAVRQQIGLRQALLPQIAASSYAAGKLAWFNGHSSSVKACTWSPDGRILVSGGSDGNVLLLDAASGEVLRELVGHSGSVNACGWSPDGSILASGGGGGNVLLWDAASGKVLRELSRDAGRVNTFTWSPDGRMLASGGDDGNVLVWDAASGEVLRELAGHKDWIWTCAWSPDGHVLASGGIDGKILLWDVAGGEIMRQLVGHADWINTCAWSPDGSMLASGGEDGKVLLWDVSSGEVLRELIGHADWISACAWSPDGRIVASAGDDGDVLLWDAASGEALRELVGHTGSVFTCAWSPDGRNLASGGSGGQVLLWDVASGEAQRELIRLAVWVNACTWSPDGRVLASGRSDGKVSLWDAVSGEVLRELAGHADRVNACTWSPDGRMLASAGNNGKVLLWDAASGSALRELSGHSDWVNVCAWSPDSHMLATGGGDGKLLVWNVVSGEVLRELVGDVEEVDACTWSPDGRMLASSGSEGKILVWDVVSGKILREGEGRDELLNTCMWSPNGSILASGGSSGSVLLWDAASGKVLRELVGHADWVRVCAWSPDARMLASGGDDGKVLLWDVASGELLRELALHAAWVTACVWSPDGRILVTAGRDGKMSLWDVANGENLRVHGICRNAMDGTFSYAVWSPSDNRIVAVMGDAWRHLAWQRRDEDGWTTRLPLEIFGPVPSSSRVVS